MSARGSNRSVSNNGGHVIRADRDCVIIGNSATNNFHCGLAASGGRPAVRVHNVLSVNNGAAANTQWAGFTFTIDTNDCSNSGGCTPPGIPNNCP